jgi:hypothetical protein
VIPAELRELAFEPADFGCSGLVPGHRHIEIILGIELCTALLRYFWL